MTHGNQRVTVEETLRDLEAIVCEKSLTGSQRIAIRQGTSEHYSVQRGLAHRKLIVRFPKVHAMTGAWEPLLLTDLGRRVQALVRGPGR